MILDPILTINIANFPQMGNLYFQNYRPNKKNIIVIGPVPGQKYSELVFPILSPDPATDKIKKLTSWNILSIWVVIEGEEKLIPTGVRATIRSIALQQQEEWAKFDVNKRVDMNPIPQKKQPLYNIKVYLSHFMLSIPTIMPYIKSLGQ